MDGQGLWTLDQLAEQVGAALSVDYAGAPSGRVRSVPDRRAIRWYTTIGLVDRPAAMRGRTALYGPRHLWQLVAIKRLQAQGRSLAEIQAALTGAPDATLRTVARLNGAPAPTQPAPTQPAPTQPAPGPGPAAADAVASPPKAAPRTDRFWSAARAGAAPAAERSGDLSAVDVLSSSDLSTADDAPVDADEAAVDDMSTVPTVAAAISLPGGVTLLLPPGAPWPGTADLHAIRTAAAPLLTELARRGVIATEPTEGPS